MSGGFTEEDQAKIADEVQARVRSKRVGLGFGGPTSTTNADITFSPPASSRSSAWFHEARNQTHFEGEANQDTTQGSFPWDGGRRGKPAGTARKTDMGDARSASLTSTTEEVSSAGRPLEREFPLIRDRDIDNSRAEAEAHGRTRSDERQAKAGRRRRRSRSRSKSRDRQTERKRDTWERERRFDKNRERGSDRRDWDKERFSRDRDSFNKSRGRHSDRSRGRDCSSRSMYDDAGSSRHRSPTKAMTEKADKRDRATPSAKQAKDELKRRLKEAVASDTTLKAGFTASLGGGGGWERSEMAEASNFFKSDEVAAKGGVASVAPEFEARMAEISAVEDEDIMQLGGELRKPSTAMVQGIGGITSVDESTQKHHDAIFSPAGPPVSCDTSSSQPAPVITPQQPDSGEQLRRLGSAGVIGGAARARLALTGKIEEPKRKKRPRAAAREKSEERVLPEHTDGEQPLFKTLKNKLVPATASSSRVQLGRVPVPEETANIDRSGNAYTTSMKTGELVEARYTADDEWYSAVIGQVIHSGFDIARYKVRYTDYGNEETISWTRIKRLRSVQASPQPLAPELTSPPISSVEAVPPPPERPPQHTDGEASEISSEAFAGLRPRSLGVEHSATQSRLPEEPNEQVSSQDANADVINPSLLSSSGQGKRLSWKEKLQARKAGAGSSADGSVSVSKKQISLVPDFAAAAQKRAQQVDTRLDKSEWRSKVVFGIGSSKASDRA